MVDLEWSRSERLGRVEGGLRAACVLVAIALCVPALGLLEKIWRSSAFFGHGYLIPAVSIYLIHRNRHELGRVLRRGSPAPFGAVVVGAIATLQALAILGDVVFVAGLCVPALGLAVVHALFGREALARFAVPIGFLAMMVPPPGFVVTPVLLELKLFVTHVAVELLQASGFVLTGEGNRILLPQTELFVADACSGLGSIITLVPLAAVLAMFLCTGIWRRAVVLGAVVPLCVAANVIRVVVTVACVDRFGAAFAQGLLHETFGTATYVVGTLVLIALARAVR